jgi:hypothetical protein
VRVVNDSTCDSLAERQGVDVPVGPEQKRPWTVRVAKWRCERESQSEWAERSQRAGVRSVDQQSRVRRDRAALVRFVVMEVFGGGCMEQQRQRMSHGGGLDQGGFISSAMVGWCMWVE